ncbi:MAG: AraC family transcriptional regulator [Gemmatimonadales bacterium]|nr:AraC family transcriptional regulator [Gemmatimonadales bacterium]
MRDALGTVDLDQAGKGKSGLVVFAPPPHLHYLIEHLWIDANRPRSSTEAAWRIVPDDAPHLIWHKGNGFHRLGLVGARSRYVDIDRSGRHLTVGVRFRPGALPILLGGESEELTDRSIAAEELFGRPARHTIERLLGESPHGAAERLGELVHALASRHPAIDGRIRHLAELDPTARHSADEIARRLGLSGRMVRLLARRHLGMGLKRFIRIRRLHAALRAGLTHPSPSWSRVAQSAGYADHSHFIRDSTELLGESPARFAMRARG